MRAGLKDDAYAHVIEAQSAVLGELVAFVSEVRAARQPPATLTDRQAADVGRQLLGGCQGWARSFVRSSYWNSQALLAAVVLCAALLGFGAGWRIFSPPSEMTCANQSDGSRLCWIYTRLPTEPPAKR
jgi:hypothetical protein